MAKRVKTKYLIIGNSAGGVAAAEAIREVDKARDVIIVSAEPYPAYSRPLISEYLADRCPLEKMLFRAPDFYESNNISAFLGKKAQSLDTDRHTALLDSGEEVLWEKLLLAIGGLPIIPAIKGCELSGVFAFTTLRDAMAIDQFLTRLPKRTIRAVVIGGGLIGVSAAEALVKRGVKVTIVEMQKRILSVILDEEASALEEETVRRAGVEILTGHTVAEIDSYSGDQATSVTLDDGSPIPCELVIAAIGVRPRTELTVGTGIKTNRGIVVDKHMATSSPDIFAAGDVAEAYDFAYGENRLTPIWINARIGGRAAGFNMAGIPAEYPNCTAMNSLKYFGLAGVSAGMVNPPDSSYEVLRNRYDHTYKKVVLKGGLIAGMVFAGQIEKSGVVFGLMRDRVKVDSFKQALVAEDFGLASLPEDIWRARLGAPASGLLSPAVLREPPEELVCGE